MTAELERTVVSALKGLDADFTVMDCDPDLADTAAFCAAYDVPLDRSANAILLASKRPPDQYAVCVVLATHRLDVNHAARDAMGVKKLSFADADTTTARTGMVIGGVTPFGLPDDIPVLVDAAVMQRPTVIVGGGSRSKKIEVDPEVFSRMTNATVVTDLAAD